MSFNANQINRYLLPIHLHLVGLGEEQHAGGLVEADPLVGLVQAGGNLVADCQQENVDEEVVALSGNVALGKKDLEVGGPGSWYGTSV